MAASKEMVRQINAGRAMQAAADVLSATQTQLRVGREFLDEESSPRRALNLGIDVLVETEAFLRTLHSVGATPEEAVNEFLDALKRCQEDYDEEGDQ